MRRIVHSLKNCFRIVRLNLDKFYRGSTSIVFLVRVEGESLWPKLIPGKRYLASSIFVPKVGDFAVFRNPKNKMDVFVKKVREATDAGYIMESVVSWGSSSVDFGPVPKHLVVGKVLKQP